MDTLLRSTPADPGAPAGGALPDPRLGPDDGEPGPGAYSPAPTRPSWKVIVAFWASAWSIVAGMRTAHLLWLDPENQDAHHVFAILDDAVQYALWMLLTPAIFWVSGRFPVTRHSWRRQVPVHLGIALAVLVSTMLLLLVLHNGYAHFPGEEYFHPPGSTGDWSLKDVFRYFIEFGSNKNHVVFYAGILTAGFAFHYYRELQRQQLATALVKSQLVEARMQALRMQLHPHFLFNTLNTVSNLTLRDPRAARRVIARLSELLRRALESTREMEVTLAEELRFAEGYLEIVRERFADRLRVELVIDSSTQDVLVPNLVLQPLLENAVEHGIARSLHDAWIRVDAECTDGRLHLRVSDNGPGLRGAVTEGVGISNTRARLHQLYGDEGTLVLREGDAGGAVVDVVLPCRTAADAGAAGTDRPGGWAG